jgi:hypothetical protein
VEYLKDCVAKKSATKSIFLLNYFTKYKLLCQFVTKRFSKSCNKARSTHFKILYLTANFIEGVQSLFRVMNIL